MSQAARHHPTAAFLALLYAPQCSHLMVEILKGTPISLPQAACPPPLRTRPDKPCSLQSLCCGQLSSSSRSGKRLVQARYRVGVSPHSHLVKLLNSMLLDCVSFPPISCQLSEGRAVSLGVPRLPVLGSQNNAEEETDSLRELSQYSPQCSVVVAETCRSWD